MKHLKSILSLFGSAFLIIFFIFFFIKGSVVTIWLSPDTPETYSINGYDGRSMKMIFLPDNQVLVWYKDQNVEESALTHMRGSYGTNYFWRFWHLEGPGIYLGYRIYPDDVKPVVMEIETEQKYFEGQGDSSFPKIGETINTTILFGTDRVKFQNMWLEKTETDAQFIKDLQDKLENKKY